MRLSKTLTVQEAEEKLAWLQAQIPRCHDVLRRLDMIQEKINIERWLRG